MEKFLKFAALFLMIGLILTGCEKEDHSQPEQQNIDYELNPITKIIGDDWDNHISGTVTNNSITLSSLQGLKLPEVGEILLKPKITDKFPRGFLGKVIQVQQNGNGAKIYTERVALPDAFNKLSINLHSVNISDYITEITDGDGNPIKNYIPRSISEINTRSIPDIDIGVNLIDIVISAYAKNGTAYEFKGDMNMKVDMDLFYDLRLSGKDIFKLSLKPLFKTDLSVTSKLSSSYKSEKPILKIKMGPILIGVVPISFDLNVYASIDAEGKIDFEAKYEYEAKAEIGILYDEGQWSAIHTIESSKDFSGKLTMNGHVGVGPSLGFKCFLFTDDVASVGVKGTALLDLNARFEWNLATAASGELWKSFNGTKAELNAILKAEVEADWILLGEPYKAPLFANSIKLASGTLLPTIDFENLKTENGKVSYTLSGEVVLPGKYGIQIYDKDKNKIGESLYFNNNAAYIAELTSKNIVIPINLTPGKTYTVCPVFNLFGLEIISNEFEKITDTTLGDNGLTGSINEIVPDDILENIKKLGLEIHGGNNPPNIEGMYLATPLELVKKNTSMNISEMWDMYVTFSGQNNTKLTVNADYSMKVEGAWWTTTTMSSSGPGSFIVGEENKFTVFVDGTRTQSGYTAKTVEVFSGEISTAGIINYQWAVIMVDDKGDPLNEWIGNGEGYLKKDKDGLSPRVTETKSSSSIKASPTFNKNQLNIPKQM